MKDRYPDSSYDRTENYTEAEEFKTEILRRLEYYHMYKGLEK